MTVLQRSEANVKTKRERAKNLYKIMAFHIKFSLQCM